MRALLCHGSVVACTGVLGACCSGVPHSGRRRRALSLPLHWRRNKAAGTAVSVVMQAAYVTRAPGIISLTSQVLLRACVCCAMAVLWQAPWERRRRQSTVWTQLVRIAPPLAARVHMNPAHAPRHKPSHFKFGTSH